MSSKIKLIILPIIILLLIVGFLNVCQADYAKITSNADAYVDVYQGYNNYGSASLLYAGHDSNGNPTYYALYNFNTVSYTHLTLPTNREV